MFVATLAAAAMLLSPRLPATTPDATAVRFALDDPTIVAIYDAANTADIETGGLGAKMGSTQKVRDFGAMLVKAHTGARQQGRDLAHKLGVTPTPLKNDPSVQQHADVMKMLSGLHGVDFDRAFLQHEVDYHKAVIAAVQNTLLPAIQNAQLKQLVLRVAPVFVQHEKEAETLLAQVGH